MRLFVRPKLKIFVLLATLILWGIIQGAGNVCFAQTGPPSRPNLVGQNQPGGSMGKAGGRWQVQPSLTWYEQYSDNVDLSNTNEVSAKRHQITPSLSFIRPSARKQMKLDTNLKLDYRDKDNGDKDSMFWADIYGYMGHEVTPRTSYELTASFDTGYTESTTSAPFTNVFGSVDRSTSFTIGPAFRYNIGRTTTSRGAYNYTNASYSGDGTADANEHIFSLDFEQSIGSRVLLDLGGLYNIKHFSDSTANYTDLQIPIGVNFDLTYFRLRVGALYLHRKFNNNMHDEKLWGLQLGLELGGNLLRLKATSVEFDYKTEYYNDIFGQPYTNEELKIGIFHAFRKFDVHFYGRWGENKYMQKIDKIEYTGYGALWRWRVSNLMNLEFRGDYDSYDYTPADTTYENFRGAVEMSYFLTDVLMVGLSYRQTFSDSNVIAGNYTENLYAVFFRAVW